MSTVRYNSLREVMEANLAQLPEIMEQAALEALNEAADFMVTIAQSYCLVDTGTLQNSIRKEQSGKAVRVIAGGYQFLNPKTHRPCTYAVHVENKNPFMRPAFETIHPFIIDRIRQKVLEKLE